MTWTIGKDSGVVSFSNTQKSGQENKINDYGVPFAEQGIPSVFDKNSRLSGGGFNEAIEDGTSDGLARFFPRDSRAVFENLLFELPMMVIAIDGEGKIINANQAVLDVLGFVGQEVTGMFALDLLTAQSRTMLKEKILPEMFETGRFMNIDVELVKKNGETVEMLMSSVAHKNAAGRVEKSIVVFADMSQRAEAQAALRQSEQRFRESFESAAHGMAILTADGRVAAANVALTELLTQSELELSRKRLSELVIDGDQDKLQAMFSRVMSGQHAGVNAELRFKGVEDKSIHGLTSISGVRDRFGKIEQLIVQIVDLTTRHRDRKSVV